MVDVQDISFQLLKSPRELAAWNFPLSQTLEEYFNLLPEPCKIHYGEAALVIQNSVNAYARRVEELYDETQCFNKKMIESKVDESNFSKKKQRSKQNTVDFSQFELLNFDKNIGKSINLKHYEEKSIKFLHHYFSQLENSYTRLHIEVFNIQGETIGKKYNFRCNQKVTKIGNLVEEFSQKDFQDFKIHNNQNTFCDTFRTNLETSQSLDSSSNTSIVNSESEVARSSSILETNDIIRYMSTQDESANNSKSLLQPNSDYSWNVIDSSQNENQKSAISQISGNKETNNYNCGNETKNTVCDDNIQINFPDIDNAMENDSSKSELFDIETESRDANAKEKMCNIEIENENVNKEINNDIIENEKKRLRTDFSDISDVLDTPNAELRRSKRLKLTNNDVEHCKLDNQKLLKPIAFGNGIPEKLVKRRKEFRLPCHINLLKYGTYKRKSPLKKNNISKDSKEMSFKRYHENKSELPNVKITLYSPTRQQFSTMNEDFPLNHAKDDFCLTFSKKVLVSSSDSRASLPRSASLSPPPDTYTPPFAPSPTEFLISPKKDDDKQEKFRIKSGHNLDKLVKFKIKKIYKELDLQSEEDQKVAKWHEEIRPRLIEAARKPPFQIHEYGSRIIKKLELCDRKLPFNEIIRGEASCEIARYFSATLQLASTKNLNINVNKDFNKSIELILLD